MEISESLKRFRQEFKLNQREVAAALNIPYQSYQGYEYGRNIPSAKIILNLARIYNVSADYLLGLTDAPRNKAMPNIEEFKNALSVFNQSAQVLQQVIERHQ